MIINHLYHAPGIWNEHTGITAIGSEYAAANISGGTFTEELSIEVNYILFSPSIIMHHDVSICISRISEGFPRLGVFNKVLVIAEIITFFASGEALNKMSTSNDGSDTFKILVVVVGICVLEYFLLNGFFRSIIKQAERSTQIEIDSLEQAHGDAIQQLTVKKNSEKKLLETEINKMMNQYRIIFEQSATCTYIVGWILNVLSNEINKADRSQWLPQIKVNVRFVVNYNFIEIPGFGKYDMASQGIQIDNNPMAVGALAYVLENKSLAEARKRFQLDPNGGRPVIVSIRNDVHVELQYSAPNGRGIAMQ